MTAPFVLPCVQAYNCTQCAADASVHCHLKLKLHQLHRHLLILCNLFTYKLAIAGLVLSKKTQQNLGCNQVCHPSLRRCLTAGLFAWPWQR